MVKEIAEAAGCGRRKEYLVDDRPNFCPSDRLYDGGLVYWLEGLNNRLHDCTDELLHRCDRSYHLHLWADHRQQLRTCYSNHAWSRSCSRGVDRCPYRTGAGICTMWTPPNNRSFCPATTRRLMQSWLERSREKQFGLHVHRAIAEQL